MLKVASISVSSIRPLRWTRSKIGCGPPGRPVHHRVDVLGQHPHQVAGDAAAGDVGQRLDLGLGDQVQAVLARRSWSG